MSTARKLSGSIARISASIRFFQRIEHPVRSGSSCNWCSGAKQRRAGVDVKICPAFLLCSESAHIGVPERISSSMLEDERCHLCVAMCRQMISAKRVPLCIVGPLLSDSCRQDRFANIPIPLVIVARSLDCSARFAVLRMPCPEIFWNFVDHPSVARLGSGLHFPFNLEPARSYDPAKLGLYPFMLESICLRRSESDKELDR